MKGLISLTCDAWQASNTDGYFAVTGSWIDDAGPGQWVKQTALFGFVRMNSAHNGRRLGKALYKVAARLHIVHKVCLRNYPFVNVVYAFTQIGWVTCDNATNNDTMMSRFAELIEEATKKPYDAKTRRIRYVVLTLPVNR